MQIMCGLIIWIIIINIWSNNHQISLNHDPIMKKICHLRCAQFWLQFWTTVVPDGEDPSSRDRYIFPSDRATSPGPHDDPHLYMPEPAPSRALAVTDAKVRQISISDIVCCVAGPDPMLIIRDFDRVYMPEGCVAVNSAVVGPPGSAVVGPTV